MAYRMEETGIKTAVIQEIREIAKKYSVQKVILFGSRARGDYERASDIDLAVLGGNDILFALDVEEEVATPLKFDVINLNGNVQKELKQSIQSEGIVLYEEI